MIAEIPTNILQNISIDQAWHFRVVPYENNTEKLCFYIGETNEHQVFIQEELEVLIGKAIEFSKLEDSKIQKLLSQYYRKAQKQKKANTITKVESNDDFLEKLIIESRELESSDIHIEPEEIKCRVRFRIDGVLIEKYILPKEDYPELVNKIKIQAKLDITEKRLPQDGRINIKYGSEKIDIRVSSCPTLFGEKIVLRLLGSNAEKLDLNDLGFEQNDLINYVKGVKKPHGMVLISGPTGSGKTTTLYATLSLLNDKEKNILTIEDPIEYTLKGINQVQLKESIGLDFTRALRTFLRQDPDIIMVGEIRDVKTAQMALRASLTGHLVLSTIHTNSAWGIISRLLDMGVPEFILADTLNLAVAQRLVRKLCKKCSIWEPLEEAPAFIPKEITQQAVPVGCDACFYTGFRGRKAIVEVVPIDDIARDLIRKKLDLPKDYLKAKGIFSIKDNALLAFENGETSLSEVAPILNS